MHFNEVGTHHKYLTGRVSVGHELGRVVQQRGIPLVREHVNALAVVVAIRYRVLAISEQLARTEGPVVHLATPEPFRVNRCFARLISDVRRGSLCRDRGMPKGVAASELERRVDHVPMTVY